MRNGYKNPPQSATESITFWTAAFFFFCEAKRGDRSLAKERAKDTEAYYSDKTNERPPVGRICVLDLPDISGVCLEDDFIPQSPSAVREEIAKVQRKYGKSASPAILSRLAGVPYQPFFYFAYQSKGEHGGSASLAYLPAAQLVAKLRIAQNSLKSRKRKVVDNG